MPTTAEGWALTEAHRLAQIRLAAGVRDDVSSAWPLLDFGRLDASFPTYAKALTVRVAARRLISARLAGSVYTALRAIEGVPGSTSVVSAADLDLMAVTTSQLVTGPVAMKRSLARGASPSDALSSAFVQTVGSMTRHVLDGGRVTTLRTMLADDRAHGYQRISDGRPCHFCAMLVSRGAVYKSEATADFRAHDHCGCDAVAFWERRPEETAAAVAYRALYDEATSGRGDKANAFRKAYTATYPRPVEIAPAA